MCIRLLGYDVRRVLVRASAISGTVAGARVTVE
jgi:hypothetical protein